MNSIPNSFQFLEKNYYETFGVTDFTFDKFSECIYENALVNAKKFLEIIDLKIAQELKKSGYFKVISFRERTIYTVRGAFTYSRRYYKDNLNGRYFYPLDMFLKLPKHQRITEKLQILILEYASRMTYSNVGMSISQDFCFSKSTISRIVKNTHIAKVENTSLIENDSKIHVQIDEKYISMYGKKYKTRYYTCTVFKGKTCMKNRNILQNVSYLSSKSLSKLAKKLNSLLKRRYKVKDETQIWLSGDYAKYIQNFPERILVCKANYVPDKFHTIRALRTMLGYTVTTDDLKNEMFIKNIRENYKVKDLNNKQRYQCSQVLTYIKTHNEPFKAYFDETYDGCSQECMNSHIYAVRFGKYANRFKPDTIEKLALIREAIKSNGIIKLKSKNTYDTYDELNLKPYFRNIDKPEYYININAMTGATRQMFAKIEGFVSEYA